ncbi:MAG: hypothetical protein R3202_10990, partial [Candidatus Competibacterales bacterium]|nr:hypothetical protein [Candidatus Competibacterales bacterium]
MTGFEDLELFALAAAAVVDTALLLALLDRANRRQLVVPLLLIVAGVWLFHAGSALHVLLRAAEGRLVDGVDALARLAAAGGLLLAPCALLHGLLRADRLALGPAPAPDRRYALLYLPLLLLALPALGGTDPAAWIRPYLVLLVAVSILVGLGFLVLRRRYQRTWVRRFLLLAGGGLLALALLHGLLFFVLPVQASSGPVGLVAALSPLPLVLLVGYFIIRFRFLQLVF